MYGQFCAAGPCTTTNFTSLSSIIITECPDDLKTLPLRTKDVTDDFDNIGKYYVPGRSIGCSKECVFLPQFSCLAKLNIHSQYIEQQHFLCNFDPQPSREGNWRTYFLPGSYALTSPTSPGSRVTNPRFFTLLASKVLGSLSRASCQTHTPLERSKTPSTGCVVPTSSVSQFHDLICRRSMTLTTPTLSSWNCAKPNRKPGC